jgi:membrane protein insertase Oxa1/YidC/SpoIIIJ
LVEAIYLYIDFVAKASSSFIRFAAMLRGGIANRLDRRVSSWRHLIPNSQQHAECITGKSEKLIIASLLCSLTAVCNPAQAADVAPVPVDNGWLSPIVDSLDFVLGNIESLYAGLGVPNAYGWSIISLTAFVKFLTLPLTKKQVESAMAVQALKPRIDVIKERYGEDKQKIQKETSRLYEQAQVNPLAGCFPSLLQIPIFIGLYKSLNNVALSGALDNEGFLWLPSLAGTFVYGTHL